MIEKLPKPTNVELADDLRTVLAHLCEDWHLEPGVAISPLCNAAICYGIDSPDLCEEYRDAISRVCRESLNELLELKCKADQKREYELMVELLGGL